MRFPALQAGRALAALAVALFHANAFLLPARFHDGEGSFQFFNMGFAGVYFFFVLSGFLMILVHRRDLGRPDRVGSFLERRVTRIYPVYWMVFAALVALSLLHPALGAGGVRDPAAVAANALLVPTGAQPLLRVSWTLHHEMLFYLAFALLIANPRWGGLLFGLWCLACARALFVPYQSFPASFLFRDVNLLFLFGMGAALAFPRLGRGRAAGLLAAGTALFLAVGLAEVHGWASPGPVMGNLGYGLGAAAMVAGLAALNPPAPRWLEFLGAASYSIYLVHSPVMKVMSVWLADLGFPGPLPPLASLAAIVAIGVGAGCLVHVAVERPMMAWFQARRARTA